MSGKKKDDCPACIVKRFWFETLEFCGCGIQGPTLGVFRDVMQTFADAVEKNDWGAAYTAREKLFGGNTAWEYLVYYVLAAVDLTEHGGSVPGWLTDEGKCVQAAMSGKTDEELDEMLNHDEYEHEGET